MRPLIEFHFGGHLFLVQCRKCRGGTSPKRPFLRALLGTSEVKRDFWGPKFFRFILLDEVKWQFMAAQNKATIINSSVGLLFTKEYFTVTGRYGSNKYAYIIGHNHHGLYCHGHIFSRT